MNFSLACNHVTELVSTSHDRRLSFRQRIELWLHIRACETCRLFRKQVRLLSRTVRLNSKHETDREFPNASDLTAEARERIKKKLVELN